MKLHLNDPFKGINDHLGLKAKLQAILGVKCMLLFIF